MAPALVTSLVALGALAFCNACEARGSIDGAQTAIAVAQTALPGVQTVLPGVQATAQAGATVVAGVLGDPRAVTLQAQALLAGAQVQLVVEPGGSGNDAATGVVVNASDAQGTFGQLDARARQAAGGAVLVLVGQYYPNATVELSVADATGTLLLTGRRAPGQAPAVQVPQ